MKPQPQLTSMIKGQMFEGFLLVRSATQRTSSNGSKYLDMTLCDISGEVNAKLWDGLTPAPAPATVLRVRGMMLEYNGKPQLRVDKMRAAQEGEDYDMAALVPCAPEPATDMLDFILNRADAILDHELKELVLKRLEEAGDKLLYYPAAMKLHHAERSGLLHHTSTMLRAAGAICEIYPALDADLLAAGVILHDLCKLSELNADEIGMVSDYTCEGQLLGHLVQGVAELDRCARELGTRRELTLMLEHMILSHHDLPEYGSPRRPMFPEAEVLHVLDLLDARMFEMNRELSMVKPGGFTDRIWSLERKLYRRREAPVRAEKPEENP
ncbi:MAG TPA: HD domain-containing protein [Candidatus Pullichristensenella excrementigallinarum]|uniref:HD domain-containing protein n=1 Tax=Candidatus Pullichristensenella excrementigallinarum TaxID=2840907 RepID=A0A9D1IBD3_9FIRM|nr:HD domain-containing protein [Candidatus Pullichristensenella excrementigallinarum]